MKCKERFMLAVSTVNRMFRNSDNLIHFLTDGLCQDSVDSASSLVSIIDEIRNNSLCNLLYMTNSSADIKAKCDGEVKPPMLPPSPIKSSDTISRVKSTMTESSVTRSTVVTSSPLKSREGVEPRFPGIRKTPPLYSAPASTKVETRLPPPPKHFKSPEKMPTKLPVNRKTSPLYTSVGSRKNLLELAGVSAESAILNTPVKVAAEKFSVAAPIPKPSPLLEPRKSGYYRPGGSEGPESKPVEFVHPSSSADFQPRLSGLVRPKPVLTYPTSNIDFSGSRPKPFIGSSQKSSDFDTSYRPTALTHFPALSPSAKYNSDNTPTPPLRENHFVRRVSNTNSKQPRRKFSVIREHFESPEVKRRISAADLYENVSNQQLDSAAATTRDKCQSVPSIFADLELRADQKYDANFASDFNQRSRSHWSTASFQKPPVTSSTAFNKRNVHSRRSMSIISDGSTSTSNGFQPLPARKPVYFDNKENEFPAEKAPAIPPRSSARIATSGNRSTLSPKSRIFSKLI